MTGRGLPHRDDPGLRPQRGEVEQVAEIADRAGEPVPQGRGGAPPELGFGAREVGPALARVVLGEGEPPEFVQNYLGEEAPLEPARPPV